MGKPARTGKLLRREPCESGGYAAGWTSIEVQANARRSVAGPFARDRRVTPSSYPSRTTEGSRKVECPLCFLPEPSMQILFGLAGLLVTARRRGLSSRTRFIDLQNTGVLYTIQVARKHMVVELPGTGIDGEAGLAATFARNAVDLVRKLTRRLGMHTSRWIFGTVILFAATASLEAAYISYEGDVFPENDGWIPGGSQEDPAVYTRSLDSGIFAINATATGTATVFYRRDLQPTSDYVCIEWQAKTSNDDGYSYFSFLIDGDGLTSSIGLSWRASGAVIGMARDAGQLDDIVVGTPLSPDEYHVFRVESSGSLFAVYVDGLFQVSNALQSPIGTNLRAQFGFTKDWDLVPTTGSWDYIRAWDVPEPCASIMMTLILLAFAARRSCRIGEQTLAPGRGLQMLRGPAPSP